MAELNLVFTVLCQHCGKPLYGRVKFCPYCGKEESISLVAGAASARRALERETTAQPEPQAPPATPPAPVPRDEVQEVVEIPAVSDAAFQSDEEADATSARFVPPAIDIESRTDGPPVSALASSNPAPMPAPAPAPAPVPLPTPTPMSLPVAAPKRPLTAKVAMLALVLVALVPATLFLIKQSETANSPPITEGRALVRGDLDREDRSAVQRANVALTAGKPRDPESPGAASKLNEAPDLGSSPAEASRVAEALGIIAAPPEPRDTPEPKETTCSQALAALALCSNEPVAGAGAGEIKQ